MEKQITREEDQEDDNYEEIDTQMKDTTTNADINISNTQSFQVPQPRKQFFNPSAPVWVEDKESNDGHMIALNQLLLKHDEEEYVKKTGITTGKPQPKPPKVRLESWQYGFAELAKHHEKNSQSCPLFAVVARVMYASGDILESDEHAVEMMYSQLEELIKALFQQKLLKRLLRQSLKGGSQLFELPDDEDDEEEEEEGGQGQEGDKEIKRIDQQSNNNVSKFVFPKQNKAMRKAMSLYIQKVFTEQYVIYQQFRQTYLNIKEEGTFFDANVTTTTTASGSSNNSSSAAAVVVSPVVEIEELEEDENEQLKEMKDHFDRENEEKTTDKQDRVFYGEEDDDGDGDNEGEENEEVEEEEEEQRQVAQDTLSQIDKIQILEEQTNSEKNSKNNSQVSSEISKSKLPDVKTAIIENANKDNSSQVSNPPNNSLFSDEERIQFNRIRTEQMANDEWNYFMQARSMTFSSKGHRKAFLSLLNLNQYGNAFLEALSPFIPFLSYSLCKIIGRIIEQLLRSRNNQGQLLPGDKPATEGEVQYHGNQVIKQYIARARRHVLSVDNVIKTAFGLFAAEYKVKGYEFILGNNSNGNDKGNKQSKQKEDIVGDSSNNNIKGNEGNKIKKQQISTGIDKLKSQRQQLKEAWRGMKSSYQKMWVERVISEKQVRSIIEQVTTSITLTMNGKNKIDKDRMILTELLRLDSSKTQFINKYAAYLFERILEDIQNKQQSSHAAAVSSFKLDDRYSTHFKNWFLNTDTQRTGNIQKAIIIPFNSASNSGNSSNKGINNTIDHKRKLIKLDTIFDD